MEKIDQNAIHIKAAHTKRALTVALKRLCQFIVVVLSDDIRSDSDDILRFFQFAHQTRIIINNLGQFHIGVGESEVEIGDSDGDIGILESLADPDQKFRLFEQAIKCRHCGGGISEVGHTKYSLIIELLRLGHKVRDLKAHKATSKNLGANEWYLALAESLIHGELGIIPPGHS